MVEGEDGVRVVGVVTLSSANGPREVAFEELPDAILWDLGANGDSDSLPPNLVERYPTLALVSTKSAPVRLWRQAPAARCCGIGGVDQLVGGLDAVVSGLVVLDEDLASDLLRRPPLALPSQEPEDKDPAELE